MRRAFTLIEVMVAIVLTSVVALLAYGSLQAGFDSSDALDRYRAGAESDALMRSLLSDALRHPADAPAGGPQSFRIDHTMSDGISSDKLTFLTRGVSSPLGAGSLWLVTLGPSRSGLRLSAHSLDDESVSPIDASDGVARSIQVRVLRSGPNQVWERDWTSERQTPSAIEIALVDSAGRASGAPLLVQMAENYR